MTKSRFILTLPLYLIVTPDRRYGPLVCVDDENKDRRGVALFTEELLAERSRDRQVPDGEIWTVKTWDDLEQGYLPLFRSWGHRYVAIDPHDTTGKARYVRIEDLEGRTTHH